MKRVQKFESNRGYCFDTEEEAIKDEKIGEIKDVLEDSVVYGTELLESTSDVAIKIYNKLFS
jgi:hypothetical protein